MNYPIETSIDMETARDMAWSDAGPTIDRLIKQFGWEAVSMLVNQRRPSRNGYYPDPDPKTYYAQTQGEF